MTALNIDAAQAAIDEGLRASTAGDASMAMTQFQLACTLAPDSGWPWFLLGSEQASAGDFENAENAWANAVLLSPDLHLARFQLGVLQFGGHRLSQAMLTWGPLLELPQDNPLVHFVNGYAALIRNNIDVACNHFEEGMQLNSKNPALSADIAKVVAALRSTQTHSALPQANKPASDNTSASHVLLSNYTSELLH